MHRDSHSRLSEANESDRLNQYLDERERARPVQSDNVDPTLVLTMEHLYRLSAQQTADSNLKRLIWTNLMSEHIAPITPLRPIALSPPSFETPARPGPAFPRPTIAMAKSRWAFGRMAATAAILAIAVATLLVADRANRGNEPDKPTSFMAAPFSNSMVEHTAIAPCSVDPRTTADLQLLLQDVVDGTSITVPTPFVPRSSQTNEGFVLPVGQIPDDASIAAVVATYAQYWGCIRADDPLRVAAMFTDSGLQRSYYPNGIPDIARIMQAERTPDPGEGRFTFDIGDPVPGDLTEFRRIGDDRIGAYVSSSSNGIRDGYVVFLQDGDRWLIDDITAFRG